MVVAFGRDAITTVAIETLGGLVARPERQRDEDATDSLPKAAIGRFVAASAFRSFLIHRSLL